MKRKLFSILISLAMVLVMMPMTALAENERIEKLDLTFTPPQCGTAVTVVDQYSATAHTDPFPEVTATGVDCSPNQGGGWYTGEDFTSFFKGGAFEGGNDCYAAFHVRAKDGYYITEDAFNNATISGATIVSKEYMGGNPYFKVKSTVVHFEHDPDIVDPTCTEPGSKTYTCQNCGKEIKESIDALGHDWGKWTKLNDEQHQRVCANDSSHIDKADHNWKDEGATYTCNDCGATKKKDTPKPTPKPAPAKISGTLLAKMTAKGKNKLELSWTKVNGAEGYDIFFDKCSKEAPKKIKTIKGNKTFKWTAKGLKKKTAYKAAVKAWVMKDGKKTYVRSSLAAHAYTSGGKKYYTNPKSVTLDKDSVSLKTGKTYKIEASVTKLQKGKKLMPKDHAPKLRYISSNKKVATVDKSGKITAKGKGSCKVFVLAVNGVRKAVNVTVK